MSLQPSQREALAKLADVLIPAGDGFPAASQAGVADEYLDQVLSVRPDLLPGLQKILAQASTRPAAEFVDDLRAQDPAAFGILAELIPGAYFLNPATRSRLGYGGQNPHPIDPRSDYEDLLQSVLDRGPVYRVTVHDPATCYDWRKSYDYNFDHVPAPWVGSIPPVAGSWSFCGRSVPSPLCIAAGPLLNGAWILYYASLGFDVLTYKTVRSRARDCYPMPNLQPVVLPSPSVVAPSAGCPSPFDGPIFPPVVNSTAAMRGSWAVSFGMPSKDPSFWRADIAATRKALSPGKLLSVSIVATPEPDWTLEDVAADFAQCAYWAVESGADCIEANFSCPNVSSADAQLFQEPDHAAMVAKAIRASMGGQPLLIKIGHVTDESQAEALVRALAPYVQALVMVNCVSARVAGPDRKPLFDGGKRGIAGPLIRGAALEQIRLFARIIRQQHWDLKLIGVGGTGSAEDVRAHLDAGAEAVQLATAAMLDPGIGVKIRRALG